MSDNLLKDLLEEYLKAKENFLLEDTATIPEDVCPWSTIVDWWNQKHDETMRDLAVDYRNAFVILIEALYRDFIKIDDESITPIPLNRSTTHQKIKE